MKILVTGAAGFIGSKLSYTLASRGDEVVGLGLLDVKVHGVRGAVDYVKVLP